MTSSTLYSIPVIVPQENVLKAFDEKIAPLFAAIKHYSKEISELTKQRDELLPLLMNGQVSVNYDLSHIEKRNRKPFYIMLSIPSIHL